MQKNTVPEELQTVIRGALANSSPSELARALGITVQAVGFNLGRWGNRPVSWDFIGRLAYRMTPEYIALLAEAQADGLPTPKEPQP